MTRKWLRMTPFVRAKSGYATVNRQFGRPIALSRCKSPKNRGFFRGLLELDNYDSLFNDNYNYPLMTIRNAH